jgi:transposase InsO family protein
VPDKPWQDGPLRLELTAAERRSGFVVALEGAVLRRGSFVLGPLDLALGHGDRVLVVVPEDVVHPGLLGGWLVSMPPVQGGHRMKLHGNAGLSVKGRELLVDRIEVAGWSLSAAAEAAGISERTARKWLARYRADGPAGLMDRSSAPAVVANRTDERRIEAIAALRRLRLTGAEIAELLGMAPSTVSGILTRIGMGKLGRLGLQPAQRYERARPGELIHVDVKKLGRIARPGHRVRGSRLPQSGHRARRYAQGWEFVHIAIDDATRMAYVEVLDDEKAVSAVAFLRRAVKHFDAHGITVERLITDNGNAYRSAVHAIACRALGIRHLRTRPYRPQTNGKAERFIRTLLAGWAYAAIYRDSAERNAALAGWLDFYNCRRPHGALSHKPPIARLNELNKLLGSYT